jgi:uncharacterized protein CbrC (UPF0167 family)
MKTKICRKCKKPRPLNGFGPEQRYADGRNVICRICINEGSKRTYRKAQLAKYVASAKEWPEEKLISEIEWLTAQWEALIAESRTRK